MYEKSKQGLQDAQQQAKQAGSAINETSRAALRNYLRAAFTLQRAGLDALDALQAGAEELTFSMLDRAEEVQSSALRDAETRLRQSAERLRESRARLQARLDAERSELEENGDRAENRVREGAEIAMLVVKVLETRVETMLTELLDLGRRELNEIEERIDALVDRLDRELEDELHPIPAYDEKNVEEVVDALDGLDEMQLRTVRAYELNHKSRVTILRAIDERLARADAMIASDTTVVETVEAKVEEAKDALNPIRNYDELNAQEVESKLGRLNVAELGAVRGYEMANKNRVTVLRAIDAQLEAKAEKAQNS